MGIICYTCKVEIIVGISVIEVTEGEEFIEITHTHCPKCKKVMLKSVFPNLLDKEGEIVRSKKLG